MPDQQLRIVLDMPPKRTRRTRTCAAIKFEDEYAGADGWSMFRASATLQRPRPALPRSASCVAVGAQLPARHAFLREVVSQTLRGAGHRPGHVVGFAPRQDFDVVPQSPPPVEGEVPVVRDDAQGLEAVRVFQLSGGLHVFVVRVAPPVGVHARAAPADVDDGAVRPAEGGGASRFSPSGRSAR